MLKYELKRAFGHQFLLALLLGICCGITGVIAYMMNIQYTPSESITCFDAWLYCNSVAESSIYKALLPLVICLPTLSALYSDRKTSLVYMVVSRTKYCLWLKYKLLAGIISTSVLVIVIPTVWFLTSIFLFPANPTTTILNLHISGIFSAYYYSSPFIYILFIIALTLLFSLVFYFFGFALTFYVKNQKQVILVPFLIYILCIIFSQLLNLPFINPVSYFLPYEGEYVPLHMIILLELSLIALSICMIYLKYRVEKKELL